MPSASKCLSLIGLAFGLLAVPDIVVGQTIRYVDDDAIGDPAPGDPVISDPLEDGSQAHPYDAIQEAIFECSDGDTVMVLDGTYTGTGNYDMDFGGLTITVRSESGPDACVIDCRRQGHGFQFRFGEGADSIVEGLTITRGYSSYNGAGIRCYNASSPTIRDCVLTDNFSDNFGGGVSCLGDSNPRLEGCVIENNVCVDGGGGFYSRESEPILIDCTLQWNLVAADGSSRGHGGGLFCYEGVAELIGCRIVGNVGGNGGGVYAYRAESTLDHCIIASNSGSAGGGVYSRSGTMALNNCLVAENDAGDGGGVFIYDNYSSADFNFLRGCTLTGNVSDLHGGGVYCLSDVAPTATNCILWGNSAPNGPQIALNSRAEITLDHCVVAGGWDTAFIAAECVLHWGDGNLIDDPSFAAPDHGDYRIAARSPCIDAGDNTAVPVDAWDLDGDGDVVERTPVDLLGQPRFVDTPTSVDTGVSDPPDYSEVIDIGAYEYQPCFGDLSGDGIVDLEDLSALLAAYGVNAGGDLDEDGDTDLADLATLLAVYGQPCF